MKTFTQKLTSFFASRMFFFIIMYFFLFEALWLVFTAIYPMAFDEDFHFGLIQMYADHWTPFLSQQPAGADKFGAVVHDPSYLYHYVMSFPYRAIAYFTDNQTTQVIILRLMNVAMFTWALVLFKRVMLRAKASPALANVTLAVFVLIPIVPFVAAHVSYDNVFMVLLPLLCLSAFDIIESLKKKQLNLKALITFVILCMAISLVKYAALPIILAAVLFLLVVFVRTYFGRLRTLWSDIAQSFKKLSAAQRYVLLGFLLLFSVLFIQRYGVNMALYKTPVPDCDDVLTVQQCSQYGPWARDHGYVQELPDDFKPNIRTFTSSWFGGMIHRMFFAINSSLHWYVNYLELPLPTYTAGTLAVVGFLSMIVWWRRIFKDNVLLAFCITVALGYILVLFLNGYTDYARVGRPVAINGRYLLPVLPLLAIAIGKGISLTLQKFRIAQAKMYLAALVMLLFLHGGGVFTFILRSDETWYWNNRWVIHANNGVRKVLAPIIIEGPKQRP
jgi:hypothetical protein